MSAFRRRPRLVGRSRAMESTATACAPFEAATDDQSRAVDGYSQDQQYNAQRDQRLWMQRLGGFVELIRNHARKREARCEDRATDHWGVADDHRHGDRLAD